MVKGCLVDVYDTILSSRFPERLRILAAVAGVDPSPDLVDRLVAMDTELVISHTDVYDDTVPSLTKLRAEGVRIALVSNCAQNTRPMLAAKGLLDLADAAVLSCEVGVAKPDPQIYLRALRALGTPASDAVMLDDQPRFCAGAAAVGIRPIQVVRPGVGDIQPDRRFTSVASLADALPLLLSALARHRPADVARLRA